MKKQGFKHYSAYESGDWDFTMNVFFGKKYLQEFLETKIVKVTAFAYFFNKNFKNRDYKSTAKNLQISIPIKVFRE